MKIITCHKCGATTTPNKWRHLGWIKVEFVFNDGNKWRQYTCAACQKANSESILKPEVPVAVAPQLTDQNEDPPVNDIWKDPHVKAALKEGRMTNDIAVLSCPKCARWGYYNQGSHFWCRFCKEGWQCLNVGEEPDPESQYLFLDEWTSLDDTVTVAAEGYDKLTQPKEAR